MFFRKAKPEPRVDQLAELRATVDEQIRRVTANYTSTFWPDYLNAASDLEAFAKQLRSYVAVRRPL